jgi:hypothetical protein
MSKASQTEEMQTRCTDNQPQNSDSANNDGIRAISRPTLRIEKAKEYHEDDLGHMHPVSY